MADRHGRKAEGTLSPLPEGVRELKRRERIISCPYEFVDASLRFVNGLVFSQLDVWISRYHGREAVSHGGFHQTQDGLAHRFGNRDFVADSQGWRADLRHDDVGYVQPIEIPRKYGCIRQLDLAVTFKREVANVLGEDVPIGPRMRDEFLIERRIVSPAADRTCEVHVHLTTTFTRWFLNSPCAMRAQRLS